jgi:alpha-galactosidase
VSQTEDELILEKKLDDGSVAVGLFNLSESAREINAAWKDLGLLGAAKVRDAWRQRDLGIHVSSFASTVAPHSVMLVRVTPKH